MGVAHVLLANVKSSRPLYKAPEHAGTPVNSVSAGSEKEWDIIIIGGGSAGCVLASSGSALLLSRIPSAYPLLFHSKHDWNLYTVPQKHTLNRKWYWPRGKLLGGCSSINAEIYHYGAPEDFAEWVGDGTEPGAQQWSYENFSPYYRKYERFTPHHKYPLDDMSYRHDGGSIDTGFRSRHGTWATSFVEACGEIGIPISKDLNTLHGSLGATHLMAYVSPNGERSTSETGYLTKAVLKRPNLMVVTGAHVTKILFNTTTDGHKRACGVEFADRRGKVPTLYRARAKKEVVLSAGAVHSPQILMLSGVGPAEHLAQHGIPLTLDLPGVGKYLKDHPIVETMYRIKSGSIEFIKPDTGFVNTVRASAAIGSWFITKSGPMSSNISESAAFLRSDDPIVFPKNKFPNPIEDSSSGPGAPDIEIICTPVGLKRHGDGKCPGGETGSMAAVLLRPTSSGTITLKSSSPYDDPVIDPHYLETQHDVDVLVRGMRAMFELAKTSHLRAQINQKETDPRFDQDLENLTDEQLEYLIRERSETLYHPTSTVRMAPLAKGGCVDYYLRVHGIPNLRVVDDSILPEIISGHTAGPAFALGEKAGDLIKKAHPPTFTGTKLSE